jgi:serine/threonine protein kinase
VRDIIRLTMPLTAGAKLDGYEVVGLLGAGGMGEVYCARDPALKREVAIKILPSFVSQDPDRLRRFEQEAQAAAALNHPNILAVHRFGTFEGAPYLVSELLEGETLRQQMERGPLPIRKAIDYGVQIAHGLAAAHDKDIVHRDLKPENLFVTKHARIKILDFGLAKLMQSQPDPDGSAPTQAHGTDPGMVMGTAGYMSPEQVRGKAVDHRTDIFAFGAILYEMLTGTRAFHRSTSAETMTAILNDDPPAISQLVQTTPPGLQRVVHRCLEKNPEQRFHSASDLAFALEALSESGSVPAIAVSGAPGQRPRSKMLVWSGGVVALLTLAAAAYLVVASRNSVPPLRVSAYTQITHDGHAKQLKGTDGSRLYFDQDQPQPIGQVAISGGEIAPVPVAVSGPALVDVSPDGSTFLVTSFTGGLQKAYPLWSVRILVVRPAICRKPWMRPGVPTEARLPTQPGKAISTSFRAMARRIGGWPRLEAWLLRCVGRPTARPSDLRRTRPSGKCLPAGLICIGCSPPGRLARTMDSGLRTGDSSSCPAARYG